MTPHFGRCSNYDIVCLTNKRCHKRTWLSCVHIIITDWWEYEKLELKAPFFLAISLKKNSPTGSLKYQCEGKMLEQKHQQC